MCAFGGTTDVHPGSVLGRIQGAAAGPPFGLMVQETRAGLAASVVTEDTR